MVQEKGNMRTQCTPVSSHLILSHRTAPHLRKVETTQLSKRPGLLLLSAYTLDKRVLENNSVFSPCACAAVDRGKTLRYLCITSEFHAWHGMACTALPPNLRTQN